MRQQLKVAAAAMLLAAALPFAAARAQEIADGKAGRAFALQSCTPCHLVAPEQTTPRGLLKAPAFRDIADARGTTQTSLHAFLATPHPTMPNLILSREDEANVIAYILSLKTHP